MTVIRHEAPADAGAREALLDRVFGAARFRKTCERLREGRLPADGLSLIAEDEGLLAGTVRLWHVAAGEGRPALLLGPLAVAPHCQGRGLGTALMEAALSEAAARGHGAVLLVGDAPYYARFGFEAALAARFEMPGYVDPARFLGRELTAGALVGAYGLVRATGAVPLRPALPATIPAPVVPRAA